mgnify:CR=1 FL=1
MLELEKDQKRQLAERRKSNKEGWKWLKQRLRRLEEKKKEKI